MFFISCESCDDVYAGGPKQAAARGWMMFKGGPSICPGCRPVDAEPPPYVTAKLLAAARDETVGFDRPERGSHGRYLERQTVRPWASHTFWWVIHNLVAHPLIGILPIGFAFRFHDWTSEKMHGLG